MWMAGFNLEVRLDGAAPLTIELPLMIDADRSKVSESGGMFELSLCLWPISDVLKQVKIHPFIRPLLSRCMKKRWCKRGKCPLALLEQ